MFRVFMFLRLFALAGCYIWAPVSNLIAASKMVNFDHSFFGLFTKRLLAMTLLFAFENGSGSQTFAKLLRSKCIFCLAVLLKSEIVFFFQYSSLLSDSKHKKGPVWIGSELFVSNLVILGSKMLILYQFLLMGFCKNLEASVYTLKMVANP